MDFDTLTAELLAQPLEQFTSARNARARELKLSGQPDLARQFSALKKPSLPLWAVNQVRDRALLGELRSKAQALVKAQSSAAAGRSNAARDLRAASETFQRSLEAAGNATAASLRQARHASGEETIRRIREILRLAALEGGETWDRLQKGALASEPRPRDDMLEMFAAGAASAGGGGGEARRAAEMVQRAARKDDELAERATATARRLRQEATEAAAAAERAAERAAAAEDEAARARAQAQKSQRAARRRGSG